MAKYYSHEGKEYPHIVLIEEETKHYLAGWYFEGSHGDLTGPYGTLEEVENEYSFYQQYIQEK